MDETNKITTVVELDTQQAAAAVVKLNATVSNSTKSLEERISAKNKVIEIQNQISQKTIAALENERRTLEGRGASEKELQAIFVKLNKAKLDALKTSEQNAVSLDRLKSSQEKTNKAFADGKDPIKNLDKATGGLLSKFQLLMSNPLILTITLLVGAFTLLKKSLESNEEGQNKLAKISAVLGSILGNITDVVAGLASTLIDLFSGDGDAIKAATSFGKKVWNVVGLPIKNIITVVETAGKTLKGLWNGGVKGAMDALGNGAKELTNNFIEAKGSIDSAKNALVNFTKEAAADAKKASEIADTRAKADKIDRDLILERSKANVKVSELREKSLQRDKYNTAQRIKFLKEAGQVEASITNKEIASAALRRDALIEENKLSGTNKEAAQAQAEAEAKVIDLRNKQLTLQRSITAQAQGLIKEEAAAVKKASTDKLAAAKKESDDLLKNKQRELKALIELEEQEVTKRKTVDPKSDTLQAEKNILEKKKELELLSTDLLESEKLVIKQNYAQQEVDLVRKTEFDKAQAILEAKNREIENGIVLDELRLEAKKNSDTLTLEQSEANLAAELSIIERRKQYEISAKDLTESEKLIITEKYNQEALRIQKTQDEAIKKSKEDLNAKILGGLAETFGIQKEVAVAQMIMAAPEAVGNSFKNAAKVYAPPVSLAMGALGAAATVVPIVKGLADIKKTRFPGKGEKSSGGGGGTISSTASSSVASVAIGDLAANNAAQLGVDPSIRGAATAEASNNLIGSSAGKIVFSEGKYSDFKNQVEFKEKKTSI